MVEGVDQSENVEEAKISDGRQSPQVPELELDSEGNDVQLCFE